MRRDAHEDADEEQLARVYGGDRARVRARLLGGAADRAAEVEVDRVVVRAYNRGQRDAWRDVVARDRSAWWRGVTVGGLLGGVAGIAGAVLGWLLR